MFPFQILNKKKYAWCFLNAFLENICLYIMPVVLSIYLTTPFTLHKFKMLIILTIVLKILEILFDVLWNVVVEPFLEHTKKDIQLAYFKRIAEMNISKINKIHTGYLKKQVDTVCDEFIYLLDEMMMTINGFGVAIIIFLLQVWFQDSTMFFVAIIFIIIIVIYNIKVSKKNVVVQEMYNDKLAKYNASNVDFLQNIKIVKNFDAIDYATNTMEERFNNVKKPLRKTFIFSSLRYDGINALVYLLYSIILINLFFQMKQGVNVFSYLVFYTSMFSGLNTELRGVARLFMRQNKFKSAYNQIEKKVVKDSPYPRTKRWKSITLKDITFKYDKHSTVEIKIPNFELQRKDKISIVGESGQGKSTFLSIFCGFLPIQENQYLIDYKEMKEIPEIAYISQETDLFDLSIRENLTLGKKISDQKLMEYLNDAGLKEWIEQLEHGLDSKVGEKGVKLSVGQKQRLNIIRGILLNKDIYILDEPTSNLDMISEEKIYKMIDKYLKNKTCIIVTHRPKLLSLCNKHYKFKARTMILDKNNH